jgi:hypothetical protein
MQQLFPDMDENEPLDWYDLFLHCSCSAVSTSLHFSGHSRLGNRATHLDPHGDIGIEMFEG